MKNTLLILAFVGCHFAKAQVIKTMQRLPDTGQNTSYTNTFGEDADYEINTPFYIDNSDGTVTDTITGLQWQQTDGGEMTFENALLYCDTLTLGGYTDWRLPNCHELFSILNHDETNPAINTAYFTLTAAEYWWGSQPQANDPNKVWVTNAGGGVGNHPKTETISAGGPKHFHVRAVRDRIQPSTIPVRFVNNANGTITDNLTGLVWQQLTYTDSLTWENALQYADTLSLAGYSDWRLPNIKELQSLNDETLINPSVDQTMFTGIGIAKFWSSTTLPNQTAKAWYLDTHFGITTYANKTAKLKLLCIRNNTTTVGLTEQPTQPILLTYPNPANDILMVSLQGMQYTATVQLINMQGQVVYSITGSGGSSISIETGTLPVGIYTLKTDFSNANTQAMRIVVAR